MRVVGVDENGLGPLLGPMICTALSMETPPAYDAQALVALGKELGLGDSKQTSGFGSMRRAEALSLASVEALTGVLPRDLDGLLEAITLEGTRPMRTRCPSAQTAEHCWGATIALPIFGGDVQEGRAWLERLRAAQLVPRRLRSVVACVKHLNDELGQGRNKLRVDLRAFEDLLLDAHDASGSSLLALCGKVGGITRYLPYLERLDSDAAEILLEDRRESAYRWPNRLEARFSVKADDRHLPVGLASMVGKYLRELLMLRQVAFYRRHEPALEEVSGYRDPRTKRFVEQSASLRRRLAVHEGCFLREG